MSFSFFGGRGGEFINMNTPLHLLPRLPHLREPPLLTCPKSPPFDLFISQRFDLDCFLSNASSPFAVFSRSLLPCFGGRSWSVFALLKKNECFGLFYAGFGWCMVLCLVGFWWNLRAWSVDLVFFFLLYVFGW